MIFCQMRRRVRINIGQPLRLADAADVRGDIPGEIRLACPDRTGFWIIRAVDVAAVLAKHVPAEEICMLGSDVCYVHRIPQGFDRWRWLRAAAAFLILMLGSALGLCWFHSDVDMPQAQVRLVTVLTGAPPEDIRWITIPYVFGVVIGVSAFYALPGRREMTPMEVKLMDYQEDMERARGRNADEE